MKKFLSIAFIILSLFTLGAGQFPESKIGGKLAPNGQEIHIDLPESEHLRNRGGSDGAGLCVYCSNAHAARWQNLWFLEDFRDWAAQYPGGSWPEKLDKDIKRLCTERNVPLPKYIQLQGREEVISVLEEALKANLFPAVTYNFSPTGRYNGRWIAHMVNVCYMDSQWVCILDNNYPGVNQYEWITRQEFVRVFAGNGNGWAVIFLEDSFGPPVFPTN